MLAVAIVGLYLARIGADAVASDDDVSFDVKQEAVGTVSRRYLDESLFLSEPAAVVSVAHDAWTFRHRVGDVERRVGAEADSVHVPIAGEEQLGLARLNVAAEEPAVVARRAVTRRVGYVQKSVGAEAEVVGRDRILR